MSDNREQQHQDHLDLGQVTIGSMGWVVVGLILYVLSVGPTILVYDGLPRPAKKAVELVYAPVVWLADSPAGGALQWYGGLWER